MTAGGAHYNFTGPQAVGVGTVADGLATIKQLVFEEKKVTGRKLLQALEDNWVGHEPLYALVNSDKIHHYGNDDDLCADDLAVFGYDTYCKYVENRPNARGRQVPARVLFRLVQCRHGAHTMGVSGREEGPGASFRLPRRGAHLCGITRYQGADRHSEIGHQARSIRAGNGTLLNWKFTPTCVAGESGRDNLISLLDVYFNRKGMHSQFNIVSRETLEAALANPEQYRHLVVRVADTAPTSWS